MKTLIIAALFGLTAGAATAGELGGHAWAEYALEEEAFEFGLGGHYVVDRLTFSADLIATKPNGDELDLTEVDLGVAYAVSEKVDLYGKVIFEKDCEELEYSETVIGAALQF